MQTELKLLSGEGNATAALVAGTVTNVAVVTLPTNPGYEYDVSIGVFLKLVSVVTTSASITVGGNTLSIYGGAGASAAGVIGYIFPFPSTNVALNSIVNEYVFVGTSGTSGIGATTGDGTIHTFKAAPGQSITCPIISNSADVYYLHYAYIGRKLITSSF